MICKKNSGGNKNGKYKFFSKKLLFRDIQRKKINHGYLQFLHNLPMKSLVSSPGIILRGRLTLQIIWQTDG